MVWRARLQVSAGDSSGAVTSMVEGEVVPHLQLRLNPGPITYEFTYRPDVNLAVQVVPAAKIESAVISAVVGPTRSRWTR